MIEKSFHDLKIISTKIFDIKNQKPVYFYVFFLFVCAILNICFDNLKLK